MCARILFSQLKAKLDSKINDSQLLMSLCYSHLHRHITLALLGQQMNYAAETFSLWCFIHNNV